jgi:DNA-binding transcriptional MerR regulator
VKIKEICEKTGLTDRTVRYYIEEGLITPFYTENYLGRKSFDFSDNDLIRLKNIATLRAFGFSIDEIKQLSCKDGNSQQIIETVKKRTGDSLDESKRILNVLLSIDESDMADISVLAEKLSRSDMVIENESKTAICFLLKLV